jgi:hypothetical protein
VSQRRGCRLRSVLSSCRLLVARYGGRLHHIETKLEVSFVGKAYVLQCNHSNTPNLPSPIQYLQHTQSDPASAPSPLNHPSRSYPSHLFFYLLMLRTLSKTFPYPASHSPASTQFPAFPYSPISSSYPATPADFHGVAQSQCQSLRLRHNLLSWQLFQTPEHRARHW